MGENGDNDVKDSKEEGSTSTPPSSISSILSNPFTVYVLIFLVVVLVISVLYLLYDKYFKTDAPPALDGTPRFKIEDEKILLKDANELDEVVKSSPDGKGTTVFFGHKTCSHCSACISEFEKAAGDDAGKTVWVADYDNVGNPSIEKYGIEGFPTIMKFVSGEKAGPEFDDDRTESKFRTFIDSTP